MLPFLAISQHKPIVVLESYYIVIVHIESVTERGDSVGFLQVLQPFQLTFGAESGVDPENEKLSE